MKEYTSTALEIIVDNHCDKPAVHAIVDEDPFYHIIWTDWKQINWLIELLKNKATKAFGPEP